LAPKNVNRNTTANGQEEFQIAGAATEKHENQNMRRHGEQTTIIMTFNNEHETDFPRNQQ